VTRWIACAAALVVALVGTGSASSTPAPFRATVERIDAAQARRMTGVSWRPGCPVALRELRLLTLDHWGFDGRARTGRLVVHEDVARDLVAVFRRLHAARFPIRRMVPVDAYGASDFRSIEADNTSAFNCRYVEGTSRWSEHAYGRAIDVNPIENPYVSGGRTSHRASSPYVERTPRRPGMAYEGGSLVRAFDEIGWKWGGRWTSVKDYQHFSASGR
jgi:D-alanyl-D-alanine carboxypeptidase